MVGIKQKLLSDIAEKLSAVGIRAQFGSGSDLTLDEELLNTGWSTGTKKINYEASIYADEHNDVVYMYEKTSETGRGLSFGVDSESSFQRGKTLFRKVKSVRYGPDGKAYEINLDLGAISKAVKETAEKYGWKFKTVLIKKKAMYPEGYISDTPHPAAAEPVFVSAARFCTNCGAHIAVNSRFCGRCGKAL